MKRFRLILGICVLMLSNSADARQLNDKEVLAQLKSMLQGKLQYYISGTPFDTTGQFVTSKDVIISNVSLDYEILKIRGRYLMNGEQHAFMTVNSISGELCEMTTNDNVSHCIVNKTTKKVIILINDQDIVKRVLKILLRLKKEF